VHLCNTNRIGWHSANAKHSDLRAAQITFTMQLTTILVALLLMWSASTNVVPADTENQASSSFGSIRFDRRVQDTTTSCGFFCDPGAELDEVFGLCTITGPVSEPETIFYCPGGEILDGTVCVREDLSTFAAEGKYQKHAPIL
jgi:hypothetical protein